MQVPREIVAELAYDLWGRRGHGHGDDVGDWLAASADFAFFHEYELIAEVSLGPSATAAGPPGRRCRLCERSPREARFQIRPPIWPGCSETGLGSHEICDICQAECRAPLADAFDAFWHGVANAGSSLDPTRAVREVGSPSLAAAKAITTSLLLILPEPELEYLGDAIEWLGNPDVEEDAELFGEFWCRAYWGDLPRGAAWAAAARRRSDKSSGPYLVGFLGADGIALQTMIPLCLRDQDREPLTLPPERSFVLGKFAGTGRVQSTLFTEAVAARV